MSSKSGSTHPLDGGEIASALFFSQWQVPTGEAQPAAGTRAHSGIYYQFFWVCLAREVPTI